MSFESEVEFDIMFGGSNTFVEYESELRASLHELLNEPDVVPEPDYFEDATDSPPDYFEDPAEEYFVETVESDNIPDADPNTHSNVESDIDVTGGGYFTDIPTTDEVLTHINTAKELKVLIKKDNIVKQKIESKYKSLPQVTIKTHKDILNYLL